MKVSILAVYTGAVTAASMALTMAGCGRNAEALTPQQLQQQYGITGAYTGQVATPDGALGATIVPVTLPDGRSAQLIIPAAAGAQPHPMYLQDAQGFHPVAVQPGVQRSQLTTAPLSVSSQAERPHPKKRSWEKDLLIVGGGAGGGAAVGALAGGKKGAALGAAAGGVGGLIYDLATRH